MASSQTVIEAKTFNRIKSAIPCPRNVAHHYAQHLDITKSTCDLFTT